MKNIYLSILLVFSSVMVYAQNGLQTIKGTIIDKEIETPLIGAFVELVDNPGVGTTTDLYGDFKLINVPVGRQAIKVSYIGYEPQLVGNLILTSGKEMILEIAMEETSVALDEVTIVAKSDKDGSINEMASISSRTFSLEEVTRYSGGRNDVSRLVSNYAGVSTADDSRNDIVIRGNSPTGVLWRLEGVAIPNPNHFSTLGTTGGPVSALNTNLIKNSDFMTSAFLTEYGNALAGVFDIGFRSGNKDNFEATLQLAAFSGLEAMFEGPINKKNSSSFVISYRHSFVQLANSAGIDIGTNATPDYRDLSFNLDFGRSILGKLSLFGIGATSNIDFLAAELDLTDIFAEPDSDAYADSYLAIVGLKHTAMLSDNSYIRTILSANQSGNTFNVERYLDANLQEKFEFSSFDDSVSKQVLRTYINSKVSPDNTLRAGINIERQDINSSVSDRDANPDLNGDGLPDLEIIRSIDDDIYTYEFFIHNKYKLGTKATFNAGMHAQVLSLAEQGFLEPRLGYSYQLNPKHKINVGYGLHSQVAPLPFLLSTEENDKGELTLVNKDLDFTKAQHIVIGWDARLGDNWRSKVELYHQYLFDVPVEESLSSFSILNYGADFGFPDVEKLVNKGTGINYGIEFTIEKFFSEGYYGLFTGSIYDSSYKGRDGVKRNTAFNNTYVFNFLAGKEFAIGDNKVLTLDFKATNAGGRNYTPVDLEESRIFQSEMLIDDQAYSLKYDPYLRVDLKIGLRINSKKRKFSQQFYLDFQNVLNRENVFANRYNRVTNEVNTLYQSGFFPDLLYRVQF